MSEVKERYNALDGVRVIAMFGILIMHVLANVHYREELSDLYKYIVHLGDFTSLFMGVSAFSVSCGYYERIKNGSFESISNFYKKRYIKILPFFAFLSLVDVVISPSQGSFFEGIANTTLLFGLIPHESITVIGVGWTLGVIFLFYLLYPFFVFCMENPIRFSLLFIGSVFFTFIANTYFDLGKVDFLFCAVYFVTGCGLYLLRSKIKKINRLFIGVIVLFSGTLFFTIKEYRNISKYFFLISIIMYAIIASDKKTLLSNKAISKLNVYSFEIYLCHMVAYRIIEKLSITHVFNSYLLSYFLVCVLVLILSLGISVGFKWAENQVIKRLGKNK